MPNKNMWPRKLTKGIFAGRTFATQADYTRALRAFQARTEEGNGHVDIGKVVDLYELLIESGIGRTKTLDILEEYVR
jgi:hypothetical protein